MIQREREGEGAAEEPTAVKPSAEAAVGSSERVPLIRRPGVAVVW